MFDDNKKIIGIVCIILVVLIITASMMLKLKNQNTTEPEPVESVVEEVESVESPAPEPIIEEETVIDEDLLAEAEDFMYATKTMAQRVKEDTHSTPEGELKQKTIASVMEIWDVDKDTIKDEATMQKLKFAEATVDQSEKSLSDTDSNRSLIESLREILRRAEEEFARRAESSDEATESTSH